ncbi:D-lactate dehydrogenase [Pseudoroseicyclus tamaricis]|uniref:Quinone-dependent D-lactate dehydrogenase n=1 Tax=Pseudoroseicyclus tamaricis TaxID=2705421 RepID=A0A6B2JUH0_9RHOB|nr:D-lactate dehydrogenase [Pseudoroseicyclus tamaricis]NDV00259.1 D-lactate dehydrogenase [Pseudoroseicyclus tamaricis]
MSADPEALLGAFRRVLGPRHVLTGARRTRPYRRGYRQGEGPVLAVLRPGSLVEQWRCLKLCAEAGVIVICQAANTGLTGGSTPDGDSYDRPVVILSTLRMTRVDLVRGGAQVICQPGATLEQLERRLAPLGREPHSVIGSSCIGASVTGGVCNNSGGALVRRGPAYTELALFAQIGADGVLRLVNHLGLELGQDPEEMLGRLDRGEWDEADLTHGANRAASDREYGTHVRDVSAASPARYNADPRRLHEASGSAGHLAVFALRLDTFPADDGARTFYIGTNDTEELGRLRRDILQGFEHLPIAGEYLHATAYDLSARYGRDLFRFIRLFGTRNVPRAFAAKSRVDGLTERLGLGPYVSDRLLDAACRAMPPHLPARMTEWRQRYEHHLILKVGAKGVEEAREALARRFPSATGDAFECTPREAEDAFLHRFAVGGAVVRYRAVHAREVEEIVALDIALPRNAQDWFETLPPDIEADLVARQYCGHFFCHVFHQEYFVRRGVDAEALKARLLAELDRRGARYPAEHNVGHSYDAGEEQLAFYRQLDPTNSFNPGIGRASKRAGWAGTPPAPERQP